MRKSVFLWRVVTLMAIALIISSLLSAFLFFVVTQRVFVQINTRDLLPTARGIAQMMAEQIETPEESLNPALFLKPESRGGFFGAQLHLYDSDGNSISYNSDRQPGKGKNQQDTVEGRPDTNGPGAEMDGGFAPAPGDLDSNGDDNLSELIKPALERLFQGEEVAISNARLHNQGYVLVGTPVADSEGGIMGAVVFTKRISELNESIEGLKVALLFSGLVTFLLMLFPCFFIARRITIPLRQMCDISLNMAKGDFSVRADDSQKGEIGELAASINHFARESHRLEKTRQDYVSNVSHELRTPIAAIRAMSETLSDDLIKDEGKKRLYYESILRESMRLSRLVDDLLELSRLQSGGVALQKSAFDLSETLEGVATIYGELAGDTGLQFQLGLPGSMPKVYSNADRVEQVLVALLDNAIKHTQENGKITLGARVEKDHIDVWVEDTGDGIHADDLPHVFDRFYQVDQSRSSEGTGLGLSIAKEIMQLLGETLTVESVLGEGTRFAFSVTKKNGTAGKN